MNSFAKTRQLQAVQRMQFSGPGGQPGGQPGGDEDGYGSDGEKKEFESDRRFSHFVLFVGALALGGAFMYSNVMSAQKAKVR